MGFLILLFGRSRFRLHVLAPFALSMLTHESLLLPLQCITFIRGRFNFKCPGRHHENISHLIVGKGVTDEFARSLLKRAICGRVWTKFVASTNQPPLGDTLIHSQLHPCIAASRLL